ncbi:MAG: nucleotidyltransferase [Firmicutes bacterium]|nr:nucleotidyltransferase [Bacillota bacterium]
MHNIITTLKALAEVLGRIGAPYMVIGGLANMVWGTARLTTDIDLALALPEEDLPNLAADLADAGFSVLVPEPREFVSQTRVLPVRSKEGIRVDLVFALLPFEHRAIARAVPISFGDVEVPCCTAEDLIILKAVSKRPKDREDIRGIVTRMGTKLDRGYLLPIIREMAELLERLDLYGLCRELERIGDE